MRGAALLSIFLTLLVSYLTVTLAATIDLEDDDTRESRVFPFLAVVQFNNGMACTGNGNSGGGVCVKEKYCKQRGGSNIGSCSNGYAICCAITAKCSADEKTITIKNNGTRIVKSDDMNIKSCRVVVTKPKGAYGVKLEFIDFITTNADYNGDCSLDDQLTIFESGSLDKQFSVCGTLSGQHMYLAFADDSDSIKMSLMFRSSSIINIKVTFTSLNAVKRVPRQCLQYFTDDTGEVRSFGWPGQQQNNQEYTVCIDTGTTRELTWRTCDGNNNPFFLNGNPVETTIPNCDNRDYIQFVGDPNKHCGRFPSGSSNKSKMPHIMAVHFDDRELPYKIDATNADSTTCSSLSNQCATCTWNPSVMPNVCDCVQNTSDWCKPYFLDQNNTGFCLTYS